MASRKSDKQHLKQERVEAERVLGQQQRNRWVAGMFVVLTACLIAAVYFVARGSSDSPSAAHESYAHVHGLGVNPADGALLVATHDGLFRSAAGELNAKRVGDSQQDIMGFSVTGSDTFIGSGHPSLGQGGPPNLGLIRSTDAGETWANVSLLGSADFHILRASAKTIYGLNGMSGELLVSEDAGATWDERELPPDVVDIAVNPARPRQAVASSSSGMLLSNDSARSWAEVGDAQLGLIGWSGDGRLYLVDEAGTISMSEDEGRSWKRTGEVGGTPVAVVAAPDALYVALHNNAIEQSTDGGATWSIRLKP